MAPPFKDVEFDILYGEGISQAGEILDLGVNNSIVDKSGSWYSYDGDRIGQGRQNVVQFLKDNDEVFSSVCERVKEALGLSKGPAEKEEK